MTWLEVQNRIRGYVSDPDSSVAVGESHGKHRHSDSNPHESHEYRIHVWGPYVGDHSVYGRSWEDATDQMVKLLVNADEARQKKIEQATKLLEGEGYKVVQK